MRYTIKELPESERPRERLKKYGPEVLSDAELLAVLIRTGTRGTNAVELAREVLRTVDLDDFSSVSMGRLKRIDGLGDVKAGQVMAALELSKRVGSRYEEGVKVSGPESVFEVVQGEFGEKREVFVGLYLDTKGKLLRKETISVGSLNRSIVHPREVLRPAVLDGAASLIVAHNHPSGDPEPSRGDVEVTRRVHAASRILGVDLLDHVVVGGGCFVSMAEAGLFDFEE